LICIKQENLIVIKYINLAYLWGGVLGSLIYYLPIINELHKYKRIFFSFMGGYMLYQYLKVANRLHYETIIDPYFEKYYIK